MRVLVVEDDESWRALLEKALVASGHHVVAQRSAFGIVNQVAGSQGERPDVVVLDAMLPGLSGEGALELLARDRRTASVPVVLMRANDSDRYRTAANLHGRAIFLTKDGRLRNLVGALEAHAVASVPVRG